MSTTLDQQVAFDYASDMQGATILEIKMGMVDRGADISWISQYPAEKEILFAPLTGLEVVGRRVQKKLLIVEVRLNVNLMAMTIEQVVAKMQRSHVQMLDTMIDRQKLDLTEDEVRPLLSLKDKAEAKPGIWFNSPEKFEEATNAAMEAQRRIVIQGVKDSRLRKIDVSQLRSAAHFSAKLGEPSFALRLLGQAQAQFRNEELKKAEGWLPQPVPSDVVVAEEGRFEADGTFINRDLTLFSDGLDKLIGERDLKSDDDIHQ
jgi:hypothetical protein